VSTRRPARFVRFVWREAVRRRLPHGVVHWRYLTLRPSEALLRQRSLWLASLPEVPRPCWIILESWLWLRWQLWSGPGAVWRSLRLTGPAIRAEEGTSLARQAWRFGTLSLGYCIPPSEIVRFRLYSNAPAATEYVYDHTLPAFHAQRNAASAAADASVRLLGDKERQTAELTELGVAMVPVLAVARRGSCEPLAPHLSNRGSLFFKPRHGSRSQGAFSAHLDVGAVVVDPVVGCQMRGDDAAIYWASLLHADDMIVQPRLAVDPEVGDLASTDDIVTVRYISQRRRAGEGLDSELICYCATLELPAGRSGESLRPVYVVLPLDPLTGRVGQWPDRLRSAEAAANYDRVYGRLGDRFVPGWPTIRHQSHVAHRHFPGVHAIAWDWAVTPDGPRLLEGNAGWGAATPQVLHGGLLATHDPGRSRASSDRSGVDQRS
jgi:hypothetical protein